MKDNSHVDGVIIGGTTEGRSVIEALNRQGYALAVSVATDLGAQVLDGIFGIEHTCIDEGRKDENGFMELFRYHTPDFVVDASHPFAVNVSATVKKVCDIMGIPYFRYLRSNTKMCIDSHLIYVDSALEAAKLLENMQGNILLTTGANTAGVYKSEIRDFNNRCFIRVLDTKASIEACQAWGIKDAQVIAKNPPFSVEDNCDLIEKYHIKVMVTKDSGQSGGVDEKIQSAKVMGIPIILIRRPVETEGYDSIEHLVEALNINIKAVDK